MKKRILDIFSGVGGFSIGFENSGGYETKKFCEIDENAGKVLKKRWVDVPVHEDVKTLKAAKGEFDVICGGFPCFVAGTMILSRRGFVNIECLTTNDEVLSHTGKWRGVSSIMKRGGAKLVSVSASGSIHTLTTEEHPYYVRVEEGMKNWAPIGSLSRGALLGQVLPEEDSDDMTRGFWKLFGMHLASMKRSESGAPIIESNGESMDSLLSLLSDENIDFSFCASGRGVELSAGGLKSEILKRVDGEFVSLPLHLDKDKSRSLFVGWSGERKDGAPLLGRTTNKSIGLGMSLIAQRAFGKVAEIWENLSYGYEMVVSLSGTADEGGFVEGEYGWKPLKGVYPAGAGNVFNISVETDESYVANGAIVHNCQDISLAGRQVGIGGERSGLWTQYARLISEARPPFAVIENVSNLRAKGLSKVLRDLASIGYDAEFHLIPASAVGALHRRERLWIVAYPKGSAQGMQMITKRRIDEFAAQADWGGVKGGTISPTLKGAWRRDVVREARIKQMGNAIVPKIAEMIACSLLEGFSDETSQILSKPKDVSSLEDMEKITGRSGVLRSGVFWEISPVSPFTDERDCGLFPTPTCRDAMVKSARPPERMIRADGRNVLRQPGLAEMMMQPKDFPILKQELEGKEMSREDIEKIAKFSMVKNSVCGRYDPGMLNPDWVELLMGFEMGWTNLDEG